MHLLKTKNWLRKQGLKLAEGDNAYCIDYNGYNFIDLSSSLTFMLYQYCLDIQIEQINSAFPKPRN